MVKWTARFWRAENGYTLVDQLATLAIVATVAAIAVPALSNAVEGQRLGMEVRNVEREIQLTRLTAVSVNRPMRMRFNCPAAGYYRRVELIGTVNTPVPHDDDGDGVYRCNITNYPYPSASNDPLTRPRNDGPLKQLNTSVSFTSVQTLEFWPNGTVHVAPPSGTPGAWPQLGSAPVNIVMTKGSTTRLISVNTLGKVQIQ